MESKQTLLDSEVHLEMKTNGHLSVVFFSLGEGGGGDGGRVSVVVRLAPAEGRGQLSV